MRRETVGIEKPGIYRARNGKLLTIDIMASEPPTNVPQGYYRAGHISGTGQAFYWHRDGRCVSDVGEALDAVEFVGGPNA